MSLLVWLPLNGDLENKGASIIQATGTNITSNTSGKIGSCYSFNSSSSYIKLNTAPLNNNTREFSYCCWFKPNSQHNGCLFSNRTNSNDVGITIFYYTTQFLFDVGGRWTFTPGTAVQVNAWNHLAFTYKQAEGRKIYLNGTLIGSNTTSVMPAQATTTNAFIGASQNSTTGVNANYLNGYLNDVRIYNHCLSAAEVHEISQGLVLHYKLDGFQGGYGNPNLITNFDTSFLSYADGATTLFTNQMNSGTQEIISNFNGAHKCLHLHSSGGSNRQYRTIGLAAGKTYTISADYYSTTTQATAWRGELNGGDYSWTGASGGTYDTPGVWKRMSYTYSNLTSNATLYFFTYCTNGTDCYIKDIKIEYGSSATVWGPPNSPTTTIQDSSGYGHNGIITGTLALSSNTSRYTSCMQFPGSAYIKTQAGSFAWNDFTALTLCAWIKPNANVTDWTGSIGIAADTDASAKCFSISNYANKLYAIQANGSSYNKFNSNKTLAQNTWSFCAATLDNTTCKIYFNGELVSTHTVNWGSATVKTYTLFQVGIDLPGGDEIFNGYYSDVRCYVTPLSAADIKQLYELGAKVDNKQNLHTYEIKETNSNLFAGKVWTNSYSNKNPLTSAFTNFNANGEYQFTANGTSAGSEYITINPTGHTYEYDYTLSVNTGNQFYIGFERYDANKTARSNSACVYTTNIKPSSNIVKQHYHGTVNLSTDGTNPCKYIALRILNGWSGTTSGVTGQATIHSFSLREVGTKQQPKLTKTGIFIEEELKEETNTKLHQNGIIETNNLIEF